MSWLRSVLVLLLYWPAASAADWPQWLGPHRNGFSPEKVSPWKRAPKVLWQHRVGEGHSSPVVARGRVFLHSKVQGKEEEELVAYDARSGRRLWHVSYPRAKFTSLFGNGPRATPAVANGRIYTNGASGVLSCFQADTGAKVWQVDTLQKFKAHNLFFGVSCSPLVEGDKLLVNVGAKGASIVAFQKDTGRVIWKSMDDPASYSSPIALGQGTQRQVIFLTQLGLRSLNFADGSVFWKFPLVDPLNESSATPVAFDSLLLASTIKYGSVALQLGANKEGKPTAAPAWKVPSLTCYFSTPVAVNKDSMYMVTSNGNILRPEAALRCIDAKTGQERWQKANVGRYHAALLRTGNNKLLMLEDGGTLILLEPNLKQYLELARATVCGEVWAHPALSDGRLYIRDDKALMCLQLGK